jgi:hypothetical protein
MRALPAGGALGLAVLAARLGFAIVAPAVSVLGAGGPSSLLPSPGTGPRSTTIPPAMLSL